MYQMFRVWEPPVPFLGRRPSRSLGEAWALDIDEIVVADRLGFSEVWISEHY